MPSLHRDATRSKSILVIAAACLGWFLLAPVATSEASPFMIKAKPSSDGGGSGHGGSSGGGAGGGGVGGFGGWGGMKRATIGKETALDSVRASTTDSTPIGEIVTDSIIAVPQAPVGGSIGGSTSSGSTETTPVATAGTSPAPVATLDLGDGNHITVSETVAHSIEDAMRTTPSAIAPSSGNGPNDGSGKGDSATDAGTDTSTGTDASNGASEITVDTPVGTSLPVLRIVLLQLVENVVTYPGEGITDGVSTASSETIAAEMPEPASLLLLASGLAFAGVRLRRRR